MLVEGDDKNEPVADTVRGILDGHFVLSRTLAAKNHYPSVEVGRSVSRVMPSIVSPAHLEAAGRVRELLAVYEEAQDLVNIGAYKAGSNPRVDWALENLEKVRRFLRQGMTERFSFDETLAQLLPLAPWS